MQSIFLKMTDKFSQLKDINLRELSKLESCPQIREYHVLDRKKYQTVSIAAIQWGKILIIVATIRNRKTELDEKISGIATQTKVGKPNLLKKKN